MAVKLSYDIINIYLVRVYLGVDLSDCLNAELLVPILANAEVQERLVPFLPEGESLPKSEEELKQTIHSPQFRQV